MQSKAVFLDRDGVLNYAIIRNGKPYPPSNLNELKIYPDALFSLQQLTMQGYQLIVITNQPDVRRNTTSQEMVEAINQQLKTALPLTEIYVCYHDDHDNCICRKPRPGLILQAANQHNISLSKSFIIGDRWKDIAAGQAAKLKTIWLDYGYSEPKPSLPATFTTNNLLSASNWIIENS